MRLSGLKRRADRAMARQLEFQQKKATRLRGNEAEIVARMAEKSRAAQDAIASVRPIPENAAVLEVGSGAHGLIFYFDALKKVGVDPLADHYRELFPQWQGRARTIAAFGENLPFADRSFDVVLSDNVVDHAERPRQILAEISRVMKPGATLYFTVHVHHPIYHVAATIHAAWRALGIPFEITPFADHTVHFTRSRALALFDGLPLRLERVSDDIAETAAAGRARTPRHLGDRLKRWFFKNAEIEVIAVREG